MFFFVVLYSLCGAVTPHSKSSCWKEIWFTSGMVVLVVGRSSCVHLGLTVGINIIRLRLKLDQKFIFILLSTSTHPRVSHPHDKWSWLFEVILKIKVSPGCWLISLAFKWRFFFFFETVKNRVLWSHMETFSFISCVSPLNMTIFVLYGSLASNSFLRQTPDQSLSGTLIMSFF